jgi:hypothetical protein
MQCGMFWNCIMKLKWTNSNVATSPIFDGLFHHSHLEVSKIKKKIRKLRKILVIYFSKFSYFFFYFWNFKWLWFHVIKSLIIMIASFVRGYIMMLKLHEWSQEIWSKNVIFKCKNYVPHLLFHVQNVFFRNSFFRHLNKALII